MSIPCPSCYAEINRAIRGFPRRWSRPRPARPQQTAWHSKLRGQAAVPWGGWLRGSPSPLSRAASQLQWRLGKDGDGPGTWLGLVIGPWVRLCPSLLPTLARCTLAAGCLARSKKMRMRANQSIDMVGNIVLKMGIKQRALGRAAWRLAREWVLPYVTPCSRATDALMRWQDWAAQSGRQVHSAA